MQKALLAALGTTALVAAGVGAKRKAARRKEEERRNALIREEKKPSRQLVLPLLHIKDTERHLVMGLVGLPGRGKTYIANRISRYLSWLGYKVRVFNVGEYRRQKAGADVPNEFFDPANEAGIRIRNECAKAALKDMCDWLDSGGQAAIYDATNTTVARRQMVADYLRKERGFNGELMWIESICDDEEIIQANIMDTKLFSPDYVGQDPNKAAQDFVRRIDQYRKVYATVGDEEIGPEDSYVKIIDTGRKVVTNGIKGYLPGRIVFFLMNLTINKSPIWLSRHGESMYNTMGKLGGDSPLSPAGQEYAEALAEFVRNQPELSRAREVGGDKLHIWCSVLQRTIATAEAVWRSNQDIVLGRPVQWRGLTEIDAGVYDGFTYAEIKERDPKGYAERSRDKLKYRYPQGESYLDVIERLEGVIFELERAPGPVLLVGHQAVLRCLLGYFLNTAIEEIPFLDVPLHTVMKLTPKAYGCRVETFVIRPDPSERSAASPHPLRR